MSVYGFGYWVLSGGVMLLLSFESFVMHGGRVGLILPLHHNLWLLQGLVWEKLGHQLSVIHGRVRKVVG